MAMMQNDAITINGTAPGPGGGASFDWGSFIGGLGSLYGGFSNAQNQQGTSNAAQAGYGMARGAYNPTLFGANGIGGTGFSVSSPAGGPGSISSSLGAFNPMYGNFAGASGNFLGQSQGLANTAAGGAQGAYQSALSSIMPQLGQMQNNLLAANQNALFQRGQMGSGSFGQYGTNNPVNLTGQSLGQGFATQDLSAIIQAQNQGLNFFNSNLQGAGALGNLGFGATNTGLGMIGAQNQLGMLPLQYSGLFGNQGIGATNAMANMLRGSNMAQAPQSGWGAFGNAFGPGMGGGSNPFSSLLGANGPGGGINGWMNSLFGGGNTGGFGAGDLSTIAGGGTGVGGNFGLQDLGGFGGAGGIGDLAGAFGPSAAGGEAALGAGTAGVGGGALGAAGIGPELAGGEFGIPLSGAAPAAAGADAATGGTALGAGAGAASALGIAALPVLAGMATSPVSLNSDYWNNFNNNLSSNPSPSNITQAMLQLGGGSYGSTGTIGGGTQISPQEWQVLSQYGITPQAISSLFGGMQSYGGRGSGPSSGVSRTLQ